MYSSSAVEMCSWDATIDFLDVDITVSLVNETFEGSCNEILDAIAVCNTTKLERHKEQMTQPVCALGQMNISIGCEWGNTAVTREEVDDELSCLHNADVILKKGCWHSCISVSRNPIGDDVGICVLLPLFLLCSLLNNASPHHVLSSHVLPDMLQDESPKVAPLQHTGHGVQC